MGTVFVRCMNSLKLGIWVLSYTCMITCLTLLKARV